MAQIPKAGKRKVTLRDIADHLGISKATVSLALNNNPKIAQATRDKVHKAIEELGYVYNRGAAGLTTGESRTVGLAVHDLTNPYFTEICAAVEAVLSKQNRMSFLCNTAESIKRQTQFIEALVEHNADGLILCPAVGTDLQSIQPIVKRRLPTVLITRDIDGTELDFVGNDEELSLRLATQHLVDLGHKRIAIVGGSIDASAARLRRAGYFAVMEAQGLVVDSDMVIDCENTQEAGERAVKEALSGSNPPTAFACFADRLALGVISGLHQMGLMPGKDVAVVGCDDIDEARRAYTQLTTVQIQKSAIGEAAAQILLKRIASPDAPLQRKIFEPKLVVRKSCGFQR